ncbi:hypothetical protein BaRGS_00015994, partial [Batillaria attramentaria]
TMELSQFLQVSVVLVSCLLVATVWCEEEQHDLLQASCKYFLHIIKRYVGGSGVFAYVLAPSLRLLNPLVTAGSMSVGAREKSDSWRHARVKNLILRAKIRR